MLDLNIVDKAALHFEGSYALTKKFKAAPDMIEDKNYPDPHFLNLSVQIRGNSFLYGGTEFIKSLNRGSNNFNASRTDIFIGVWF